MRQQAQNPFTNSKAEEEKNRTNTSQQEIYGSIDRCNLIINYLPQDIDDVVLMVSSS